MKVHLPLFWRKALLLAVLSMGASSVTYAVSGSLIADTENKEAVDGEEYTSADPRTWRAVNGYSITNLNGTQGNSVINTAGTDGIAIYTDGGGKVTAKDLTVTSNGYACYIGGGGSIEIDGGSITGAAHAIGADAVFTGNNLHIQGSTAPTGERVHTIMAKFAGHVNLSNSTVISAGGIGVFVNSSGSATLSNLVIDSGMAGVRASENISGSKTISMENITITTRLKDGYGVQAAQKAVITAKDLTITTEGSSARGLYVAEGGVINLSGTVNVTTKGTSAYGLLSRYTVAAPNNDDTVIRLAAGSTLTVTTKGSSAYGVYAEADSASDIHAKRLIELNGSIDITTEKSSAHGLYAIGTDSIIHANGGGSIHTLESNAAGINVSGGGLVTGNNLAITTEKGMGVKLAGSAFNSKFAQFKGASKVELVNSIIDSGGDGVELTSSDGANNVTYIHKGGSLSATNHAFIVKGSNANNVSTIQIEDLVVNAGDGKDLLNAATLTGTSFTAARSTLNGNITTGDNNTTVNVDLSDNSVLTGYTVGKANLSLLDDTTTFFVTGDSSLGTFKANGANVDFHKADTFSTLTTEELSGGGVFTLKTDLVANLDSTEQGVSSDFITVTGDFTGEHTIRLQNQGTDLTGEEITPLWVASTVNSTTGGTFGGTNTLAYGMYSYNYDIVNGETADSQYGKETNGGDNNWYAVYTGKQMSHTGSSVISMATSPQFLWFAQMDSLGKRMGELRLGNNTCTPVENIWVRTYGSQLNIDRQVSGVSYRTYIYGVDLGVDKAWRINSENTLYTGLFMGYGRADQDYRSYAGDGSSNSYQAGFYSTWLHKQGWYADFTGKGQYFDNRFHDYENGQETKGDFESWGLGFSLEAGRQFQWDKGWFIEPQLQVSYAHVYNEDYSTTGANAFRVGMGDADIWQFRGGIVFGRTIRFSSTRDILQPYVKASCVEQASSGGRLRSGEDSWRPHLDGTRLEIGTGLIWQLDEHNQLHLDYEAAFASKFDKPWGVNFGFRHQF